MDKPGENSSGENSPSTSKNIESLPLKETTPPPKKVIMDKSVPKRGDNAARPLSVSHDTTAMHTSGISSCKESLIHTYYYYFIMYFSF